MSALNLLAAVAMEAPESSPGDPVEAARAGDFDAFERLIRQYERLVLVTALRLLGDLGDAQDVSQDVFLKLYKNLGKLETCRVASWLYRVTVNACHDLRRKRPASVPIDEAAEIPARGSDPQQGTVEAERRRVLAMSLRVLSEKERAALVLRDLEGLSTDEVAQVLGSSEATVRSQVAKARIKMKDFVERYFRRRS
jgi:RNA polymerase sigma-70 factor (ECF subfamily)